MPTCPLYDIQLLQMFPTGLDELEAAGCDAKGCTRGKRSIGAIVEEADYHQRLLAWPRAYRQTSTHRLRSAPTSAPSLTTSDWRPYSER